MNPKLERVNYRLIEWLDWIPQGRYRVGDDGTVWSFARGVWKPLKARTPPGKIPCVRLTGPDKKGRVSIASLVCRAFHGPRPIGSEPFRFPDSDLNNNRASNQKWAPKGTRGLGVTPQSRNLVPQAAQSEGRVEGRFAISGRATSTRSLNSEEKAGPFKRSRTPSMTSQYVISSVTNGRVYSTVSCDRSIPDGLQSRGDRHPGAKLTSLDIPEIRERSRGGMTIRSIAREYGVSRNAILQILRGRSWTHIPDHAEP